MGRVLLFGKFIAAVLVCESEQVRIQWSRVFINALYYSNIDDVLLGLGTMWTGW
jgi:hypothetical protein